MTPLPSDDRIPTAPTVGRLVLILAALAVAVPSANAQEQTKGQEAAKSATGTSPKDEPKPADVPKTNEAPKEEPKDSPKPVESTSLSPEWVKGLAWRPIGPANMGGRVVALSVFEADPCTFWVATGGGGLLKTENNGVTFEHQFDKESTVSIGDVCVAPSDRKVVWVGTGENNPRNSVSFGDGVYKSVDGGKTWTCMGLKNTYQIGKILIHPKDPNIVYVGALGRLYGPSLDRGLYKTCDGGKTWERVLYVDFKTGVIDMRMHPLDPETLMVATYERQRDEFDVNEPAKRWGPGSGLYRTTDGGKSFVKVTKGLPECNLGRIGLDWHRKDPNLVVAIVESEKNGFGPPNRTPGGGGYLGIVGGNDPDRAVLRTVVPEGPAAKAGLESGDVLETVDGKPVKTYAAVMDLIRDKKPEEKVKLGIKRGDQKKEVEVEFARRPPNAQGNIDPTRPFAGQLNSQRENVQDRQGPDGYQTGGVYKSTDGGATWSRVNSINPRPMYFSQVRIDPSDPELLYVLGIEFYRSKDGGKTFRNDGGKGVHADGHALWIDPKDGRHMVLGCDGGYYATYDRMENWDHLNQSAIGQFYGVAVDTRRDYRVYGGLQDNGTWGGPSFTHSRSGPVNEDWVSVGGGDGFGAVVDPDDPDQVYFTSQGGAMVRRNFRTRETAAIRPRHPDRKPMRFNWNTPFIVSHHNSKIFYCAGNYLFRSLDRGEDLKLISPELTRTDQGSATAISESPRDPNVLYVGTDDGHLWVTKDGGKAWEEISKNVKLAGPRYVDTIEASRFANGRVYAAFDGHRSDDDEPMPYVSDDYGKTWKPLKGDLPTGPTRCLREDLFNPDVLYLGTEFFAYASIDRGKTWSKINANLPTVAIHDFAQHPTAGEVVAATHGRSLWILDVTPIRQTTPKILSEPAHLYRPVSAIRWRPSPVRGGTNRQYVGQNPQPGARVDYYLAKKAEKINIKVLDHEGTTIRELRTENAPGLHRTTWDMTTRKAAPPRETPGEEAAGSQDMESGPGGGGGGFGGGGGGFGGGGGLRPVPPGMYRIVLTVDGKEYAQSVRVEPDPNTPPGEIASADAQEQEEAEMDEEDEEEREARGGHPDRLKAARRRFPEWWAPRRGSPPSGHDGTGRPGRSWDRRAWILRSRPLRLLRLRRIMRPRRGRAGPVPHPVRVLAQEAETWRLRRRPPGPSRDPRPRRKAGWPGNRADGSARRWPIS